MFSEIAFDDSDADGDAPPAKTRRVESKCHREAHSLIGVYRFHQPGDDGFSPVALRNADSKYDDRFSCGEIWNSRVCRCLTCDVVRVTEQLRRLPARPIVVLLDLDNWGFPQFKSASVTDSALAAANVYVWAFYGACFARHFNISPEEYLARAPSAQQLKEGGTERGRGSALSPHARPCFNDGLSAPPIGSLWNSLVALGRITLTPCGAHSQAVDDAMMRVVHATDTAFWFVFVTCDVHLNATAEAVLKARNGGGAVNPAVHGRRMDAVWAAIVAASKEHSDTMDDPTDSQHQQGQGKCVVTTGERVKSESEQGGRKRAREMLRVRKE